MRTALLFITLFLATGCASQATILQADADCNSYRSKKEYRDCLIEHYKQWQEEVEAAKETAINCIIKAGEKICN